MIGLRALLEPTVGVSGGIQVTIVVLFAAMTLILIMALAFEFMRYMRNRKRLGKEIAATADEAAAVVVKQEEGDVRFTYSEHPNGVVKRAAPAPIPAPVPEPEIEEEPESVDGVLIPKTEKLTFAAKYERLPEADRRLLDEFAAYVTEKPDCDKILQTSALNFKFKKGQIAKAIIRRDAVVLNFAIVNPDLNRMVREEKMKGVIVKPVEIRLTTPADLELAKQTADLTVDYLAEEEEYRIEKRREARRDAARAKREAERTSEESGKEGSEE